MSPENLAPVKHTYCTPQILHCNSQADSITQHQYKIRTSRKIFHSLYRLAQVNKSTRNSKRSGPHCWQGAGRTPKSHDPLPSLQKIVQLILSSNSTSGNTISIEFHTSDASPDRIDRGPDFERSNNPNLGKSPGRNCLGIAVFLTSCPLGFR